MDAFRHWLNMKETAAPRDRFLCNSRETGHEVLGHTLLQYMGALLSNLWL